MLDGPADGKKKERRGAAPNEGASSAGEEEAGAYGYEPSMLSCTDGGARPACTADAQHSELPIPPTGPFPAAGKGASQGIFPPSEEKSSAQLFWTFFFHTGIPSFCLRLFLCSAVLIGVGVLSLYALPQANFGSASIGYTCTTLGSGILGFVLFLSLLHLSVVFCHQRRLFYDWSLIHYVSELEKYIALMLWIFVVLVTLSFVPPRIFADAWIFGSAEARHFVVQITLGILLTTVFLAIKRHYMTGLAMSFNYSNYKDRVQESLFADRMLSMLQKSRHTYKFRQKWRAGQHPASSAHTGRLNSPSPPTRAAAANAAEVLKSARLTFPSPQPPPATVDGSVRSAMEIFSPAEVHEQRPASRFTVTDRPASPLPPPPPPPSPSPHPAPPFAPMAPTSPLNAPPSKDISGPPQRSVAAYLTESDKKLQFLEFFRLANKMISRFSNVSDYRVEIKGEAKRMVQKLYKYLRPYDRNCLLGQDLLPYIEDENEFRRAISMIKRYSEGAHQGSVLSFEEASSYAFGQQDLQSAVDGILTELYVTTKSLQTVETALDKVDSFFTILVVFLMMIIIAVVRGDAYGVNLLVALSTMLSGAAFSFGTSATNMFESMIFLLVIHPFDVGDRIFVPLGSTLVSATAGAATMTGFDNLDNLVVAEMHLLSTVFERWDGVKVYVPNYVLAAKPVFNIRRSGPILEVLRIQIDFSTHVGKIEELRRRLDEYVRRDQSDYTDVSRILIESIENCNRIGLCAIFQHTTNWQDMDTQLARRSKMLAFLKESIEALEIAYLPPVQRVAMVPASELGEGKKVGLLTAGEIHRLLEIARTPASAV